MSDYIKDEEKGYNKLLKTLTKDESKKDYIAECQRVREKDRKEKSLHGQYPMLTQKLERKKQYRWIRNGYMKKETEGLITVSQNVHWNLCKKFDLPHATNWYDHVAEKVTENNKAKVLCDFSIQTDHVMEARRPDIVVLDKEMDHTWVIDIAVPGD